MEGGGGCEVVKGEESVVVVKGVGGSVSRVEREYSVLRMGRERVGSYRERRSCCEQCNCEGDILREKKLPQLCVMEVVEDDKNGRGNGVAKNLGEPSLPSTT
ncbi:hypothetical protein COLO4_31977 [Corchorus olitorius]|uniref:Uncharacterized protein n=1 Tax=Corchorus olitorius TaxID=93759 RepID=A0A1R3H2P1_9ROSI|nr:hypothetical protein COLO4_31977 [Corchorus olitorius]